MSVNIKWALSNGGTIISGNVAHGAAGAGTTLSPKTLFISHDGTNSITGCKLYLAPKSGSYTGSANPTADFNELLDWGNQVSSTRFGGVQVNMDALGGFPNTSWGTNSAKDQNNGYSFRSAVGDSSSTALLLKSSMNLPGIGVIPAGTSPNISLQIRVKIPSTLAVTGTRQFDLKLRYTYTN